MKVIMSIMILSVSSSLCAMEHEAQTADRLDSNRSHSDSDCVVKPRIYSQSTPELLSSNVSSKNKPLPRSKIMSVLGLSRQKTSSSSLPAADPQLSPERAAAQAIFEDHKDKLVSPEKSTSKKQEKKQNKRDQEKIAMIAQFMAENGKHCSELLSNRSGETSTRTQGSGV